MLKYSNVKTVTLQDWDQLVQETYGKTYSFQQQEGCQSRGNVRISVPSIWDDEDDMNDSIPEVVNHETMGVKFDKWLERDPKQPLNSNSDDFYLRLWWSRNFYPSINTLINDLYSKGLIKKGDYVIDIDW